METVVISVIADPPPKEKKQQNPTGSVSFYHESQRKQTFNWEGVLNEGETTLKSIHFFRRKYAFFFYSFEDGYTEKKLSKLTEKQQIILVSTKETIERAIKRKKELLLPIGFEFLQYLEGKDSRLTIKLPKKAFTDLFS